MIFEEPLKYDEHLNSKKGLAFSANNLVCGRCLTSPPHFDQTLSPLRYEFPINRIVNRLKDKARYDVLQLSSQIFIDHFAATIKASPPELILPVPLHNKRLYLRGYNQAAEWALMLSNKLDIPCHSRLCQRQVDTPHQRQLTASERRKNLKDAFVITPKGKSTLKAINHVAIVDDVMTTGTTMDLFAQELKLQGIKRVDAWCLARTPSHRQTKSQH